MGPALDLRLHTLFYCFRAAAAQDVCGDGPWVQEAASAAAAAAAQAASFGHVEALERVVSAASAMVGGVGMGVRGAELRVGWTVVSVEEGGGQS